MITKPPLRDRIAAEILHWLPKQALSRGIGWASRLRVPSALREPLYRGFSWRFGVDLGEVDRPLRAFERFDDFFCRPLPEGARAIAAGSGVVCSPCDGVLKEHGIIEEHRLIQAKGIDYTLAGLLRDDLSAAHFARGTYATLYLAPHNYHRVHAPLPGRVVGYRHVPGARYPVNDLSVRTIRGVFQRNERLITYMDTALGRMALVMVAATGVGNITVSYEPRIATRAGGPDRGALMYESGKKMEKGEELGVFHLGSTVILLFEPGRVRIDVPSGSPVRLGQALGQGNPNQ